MLYEIYVITFMFITYNVKDWSLFMTVLLFYLI